MIYYLNIPNLDLISLNLNLQDRNSIARLKWVQETNKNEILCFFYWYQIKTTLFKIWHFTFFNKAKDFDKLIETIKNNYLLLALFKLNNSNCHFLFSQSLNVKKAKLWGEFSCNI